MMGFSLKNIRYEHWPWPVLYFPAFVYGLYLAIRSGSLAYFSAANPNIPFGGAFMASKAEVLKHFPKQYIPKTIFIPKNTSINTIFLSIAEHKIGYPCVIKPDKMERGVGVSKIESPDHIKRYFLDTPSQDLLLQEFITYPEELGVLFYKTPDGVEKKITSVTHKAFVHVVGDGVSDIEALIKNLDLPQKRKQSFIEKNNHQLSAIPQPNEKIVIEPIGNHNRGTAFLNKNSIIDKTLTDLFDELSAFLPNFYFGRFDLKIKDLKNINHNTIKILEVNGVNAEPGHIYDPKFNLFKAYKVIFNQTNVIFRISQQNRKRGFVPCSSVTLIRGLYTYLKLKFAKPNHHERSLQVKLNRPKRIGATA